MVNRPGWSETTVGEAGGRRAVRQDDLYGAGGGFGLEFDDAADDGMVPVPFGSPGRVGEHLFQPADQVALVEGELAAHAPSWSAVPECLMEHPFDDRLVADAFLGRNLPGPRYVLFR